MLPVRRLELRRHAQKGSDLGGDCLSPEGVEQAHRLGHSLRVGYTHLYSSGAQRATQTLACVLAGMGRFVMNGVVIRPGLGSPHDEDWRQATHEAKSARLADLVTSRGTLVRAEAQRLASELRAILGQLPEGGYALAIGHSPLIECGIYGLMGQFVDPLIELDGYLITEHKGARLEVERTG